MQFLRKSLGFFPFFCLRYLVLKKTVCVCVCCNGLFTYNVYPALSKKSSITGNSKIEKKRKKREEKEREERKKRKLDRRRRKLSGKRKNIN